MRILFLGDVVGRPGREIIKEKLSSFRKENGIDFVIVNGENAAGGSGLTPKVTDEILRGGVDVITSGDHIWKKREIYEYLDETTRLVRPANYPKDVPGKGSTVVSVNGIKVGVINIIGRVFMDAVESPFEVVLEHIEALKEETNIIIVDFHAEATSEKVAMGWYLDGKVTAVLGTHTHIQTADEKILPGGTAFITDCGMTGPYYSVIGRKKEQIILRFLTNLPTRFEMAEDWVEMHGVIIDVDEKTGKAIEIKRVQEKL